MFFSIFLAGCATAPREPAGKLADAGIAATNAFATDVRDTAAGLRAVDSFDSFTATYAVCRNTALTCEPQLKSKANAEAREALARTIELRAVAIEKLGGAYKAFKAEADYDAKGELMSATNGAIEGVNNFASSVATFAGVPQAALLSKPLATIVSFGTGQFAGNAQRKRLLRGSREISITTQRFRGALAAEAYVFDDLADNIEKSRRDAKLTLIDAKLVSQQEALSILADHLGVKPVSNAEAIIDASPAATMALRSVVAAQSRAEVRKVRAKYQAALDALDALIAAHRDLEATGTVSLADVSRFLAELDLALSQVKETSNVDQP
ncbi:hypothetical protein [Novosphingobium resinovorum]|uniref:hypothetical protein n=1 Tax=Novosphingobium resinovorum TaxID=158500 RepID=UPI002ED64980|nr:hypothetical protein [Novosphingobium resinovorum]